MKKKRRRKHYRTRFDPLNKALAEIVGGFCHDLNNSLGACLQTHILLLDSEHVQIANRRKFIENALSATQNALKLVKGLYNLVSDYYWSKGKTAPWLKLSQAKAELVNLLKPIADKAGVKLSLSVQRAPKNIRVPRALLWNFSLPLVVNACEIFESSELRHDGRISVCVDLQKKLNEFSVVVSDNGPGWGDYIGSIRDGIRQGQCPSSKGSTRGYGLAHLHRIIRRLGGCIILRESAEGGAEVEIRIPANQITYAPKAKHTIAR